MRFSYYRFALGIAASALMITACGGDPGTGTKTLAIEPEVPILLETPPAGQLPADVSPLAYRVSLTTDPRDAGFTGHVEIDIALEGPHARIWLHSLDQDIESAKAVLADGTEIPATYTGEQAKGGVSRLDFAHALPAGPATLVIDYSAPYNLGLAGLYKAPQAGLDYLASQMEPFDARRMVPSFDEPRFKTPWTLTVTAPEGMTVVSNSAEVSASAAGDGWTRHQFATTRPIQSYLVALMVGPYEMLEGAPIPPTAIRSEPIPLRAFAAQGKVGKTQTILDNTAEILTWQEDYFDYPYPYGKLDLIAAPEYAYGAMENAGAIVYRESVLLIDDQTSLVRRRRIDYFHAHELSHQWFGNLVTPEWWDDAWLNEAFATWMGYKTMDAVDPDGNWALNTTLAGVRAMSSDMLSSARYIRNPIVTNGDIGDAFDAITYSKGGSVLNMFETFIGADPFRDGIRLHMRRFDDGVADAEDFMQSLADGSGHPEIIDAFRSYILQPGIPDLDVQVSCPAIDAGLITITQKRYAPLGSTIDPDGQIWGIPFAARIKSANGDVVIRQMLTNKTSEIALDGGCADWVMPNAEGTGYWRFNTNAENLAALTEAFDTLSPGEQVLYVDALTSGYLAGRVDTASLLSGLEATISGHPSAVSQSLAIIGTLAGLLNESEQGPLKTWVQATYGSLYTGLASRPATELNQPEILLRDDLYTLLLKYGVMPAERAALLTRAQAYVGMTGTPDPSALAPGNLDSAMTIGMQAGGRAFYEAALAYALTSSTQSERATIFAVIAQQADAEPLAIFMKTAQGNGFSGNEIYTIMTNAISNRHLRETGWPIFEASFDNIVPLIPEIRKQQIAGVTGRMCNAEDIATAKAFFESKAPMIPGYERSLAQGIEQGTLCSALRAQKVSEVKSAFQH